MSKENTSFSFRCPVHQSPGAIAHTFNYEPNISIKIDGIFKEIVGDEINAEERLMHYPVFPSTWTKIEGEYYQVDTEPPIFYVFYIESSEKTFANIQEMYEEIENYFIANTIGEYNVDVSDTTTVSGSDTGFGSDLLIDMLDNIKRSFDWRDKQTLTPHGLIWFPKKYWKLDTSSWDNYIDQLDQLFTHINSVEVKNLIKHDGLVISPNVPSVRKSLVKLKPIEDLTIDLFFNGRKFFSRERTDYTPIIGRYQAHNYKYGSVYRLAPIDGKFMPVYEREKGKKANPDNIIADILYKFNNYFQISQLKGAYFNPWYAQMIESGLPLVEPLFNYTQTIYNSIIRQINRGKILDIGCGAMGQYHRSLNNNNLVEYIGLDLDLAKLHEAQVKVKYDEKYKFVLLDINHRWNKQNDRFPNDIWNTYFYNMGKLNQKFDSIISVFSSQYANQSKQSWANYVNEINFRSKPGTKLFIMWINHQLDTDTYTDTEASIKYHKYDPNNNTLDVNLPHRESHSEFGLGNEIRETFLRDRTNKWRIDNTIVPTIPEINKDLPIYSYIRLVDWIVLEKI